MTLCLTLIHSAAEMYPRSGDPTMQNYLSFDVWEESRTLCRWELSDLKESVSALNLEIIKTWMFQFPVLASAFTTEEAGTGQVPESCEVRRGTSSTLPSTGIELKMIHRFSQTRRRPQVGVIRRRRNYHKKGRILGSSAEYSVQQR